MGSANTGVAPPRSLPKAVRGKAVGYVWLSPPEEMFQLQCCRARRASARLPVLPALQALGCPDLLPRGEERPRSSLTRHLTCLPSCTSDSDRAQGQEGRWRPVPADSRLRGCKGLPDREATAQGDFEEPPPTLPSQGLPAAAEAAAGRVVGAGGCTGTGTWP